MSLSRRQRQQVREKSGGRCWYCGCELPEKGWHADHFHPVIRETEAVYSGTGRDRRVDFKPTGNLLGKGSDTIDNMVPACAPCNLFKATFHVEGFRQEIEAQVDRARRSSINFRTAERFGLVRADVKPVVFWFEREGLAAPDLPGSPRAAHRKA